MKLLSEFPRDDVLSELLRSMRVRSSIYCHSHLTAPWGFRIDARPVASFHLVMEGRCWLGVPGSIRPLLLVNGDLVILPHGHAHQLSDERGQHVRALDEIVASNSDDRWRLRYGGNGRRTELLCGGFAIEECDGLPLLATLPSVIHVRGRDGQPADWLEPVLAMLRRELTAAHPGVEAIVTRLTDVLLVQAIRGHRPRLDGFGLPASGSFTDPQIASALRIIHEQPDRVWTVNALAAHVAMSRSAFSARFRQVIGESPIRYLMRFRLATAAERLRTSGESLVDIALETGYASDAALSKAFKRNFGVSPGAYRQAARDSALATLPAPLLKDTIPRAPSTMVSQNSSG